MIRLKSLLIEQSEDPFAKTAREWEAEKEKKTAAYKQDSSEEEAPAPEEETEQSITTIDPSRLMDTSKIYGDVDDVVDNLDGWVYQSHVLNIYRILRKYATDSNGNTIQKYVAYNNKVYDAAQFFAWAYSIDETGDSLYQDIQSIGTKTFDTNFLMNQWPKFLEFIESINISNISQDSRPDPITDPKVLNALKPTYQSISDTEMRPSGWEFIL